jgi:class 3 adenylate cyclase/tetratricopeptide (TPR) repeat protein
MAKLMTERERLEEAIELLEQQRAQLGDTVVEAASAPLRAQLAALNRQLKKPTNETASEPLVEPLSKLGADGERTATSFDGERRVVTILFCDVQGSTAIAEKLDPEEWARTIQSALEYMTGPIHRHGGRVVEVRGDGVLAFFGAPLAHEDDPQRAVLAGLEIIEGVQAFQEQMQRERRLDFNVRVGIHTGLVVVGEVGREQQMEYAAFGDAMNLAARMEQTARPGTVQISAQTYQLVKQVFNCEPLGEIKVKGKRLPVQSYRVVGLKVDPAPLRGLERQGLHSPLVGREAEFGNVRESFEQLLAGQGGILGIFGEAGIGKSRLIEEIHDEFLSDRLCWLEGQCLTYGPSIPYWPFREILRSYAGSSDQDGEGQAWDKLESQVKALFPEKAAGTAPTVAEIMPYLASLLGLEVRGEYLERVEYLDGETLGKQIFLATWRFFERLVATRPVALIFEDLQWMDEASAGLLEHLLPLIERAPLLIAGLGRPSWETPSDHLMGIIERDHVTRYTAIRLAPLTHIDSARLVRNLLEMEALPAELHDMVVDKAEGNPFFLEEILRALIDLGALQREAASGSWRVMAPIEGLTIPDNVQGVILARLDQLEEEVKGVLRVAAVIGRSFLYRVLKAVAGAGGRLDGHLAELQTIELIQEKQGAPELEYVFKHALAHEATYESILLEKRRALHAQVGQVIESLFAKRLEEFYGLLAYHYAKAEAWEQAQAYLLKAADQAERMAADSEALQGYQQALEAYGRAFGEAWDPVERARLERRMGEAFFRRGEWTQALGFLRRALACLGHPLPDSRWAVRAALVLEVILQIGHSLFPGLFRKQNAGPAVEEQLQIYQILEVLVAARDPEFSLLVGLRMLNFCEQHNLPAGVARASAGLGIVLGEFLHLHNLAGHYLLRAVSVADQLHRPDALGLPYTGLMTHEGIMRGQWEPTLEHSRRFAGAMREIGNLGDYSVAVFIASTILIWKGDFARALAEGQEQAQLGREAAGTQTLASGVWVQGFAERCLGRLEVAIDLLSQALEIAEASGNVFLRVQAANELGQCYLRQAQWQTALDILESNENYITEHNFGRAPFPNAMLRNGLAGAYLLASERSVHRERNAWLEKAGRACRVALKWGNSLRPGMPEALRLQGRYAWLRGNTAKAQSWWLRSLAEAEMLGMPYEAGLAHLEVGQRLGDLAHLKKAEGIFARIGAERDLVEVREYLTIISPNWTDES